MPTIREYFWKSTSLRGAGVDFEPDEKRLQAEFDKRTLLRWNHQIGKAQVWYDAPSGLYCVMTIEAPYSISKVIWILKHRQQDRRQMAQMYKEQSQAREKESEEKIDDTVGHTADALRSWSVGKVTASGKGLSI